MATAIQQAIRAALTWPKFASAAVGALAAGLAKDRWFSGINKFLDEVFGAAVTEYLSGFLVSPYAIPVTIFVLIFGGAFLHAYITRDRRAVVSAPPALPTPAAPAVDNSGGDMTIVGGIYRAGDGGPGGDGGPLTIKAGDGGGSEKPRIAATRVGLLDFRTKAIAHGWPAQLQDARWMTFLSELRQAASDGDVAMWGRRMKKASSGVLYGKKDRPEPLLEIDKGHWATFQIEANTFLSTETNASPRSYDLSKRDWGLSAGRQKDLHAGAGALEWLATTKVPPP